MNFCIAYALLLLYKRTAAVS